MAGDIDGIFGVKTKTSLRKFSIEHNQSFAPEISSRQIEVLFDAMSPAPPREITDKESIKDKNLSYIDQRMN